MTKNICVHFHAFRDAAAPVVVRTISVTDAFQFGPMSRGLPLKIPLHVYFPGRCVAEVNVVASAQIRELRRLAQTDSITFICNGMQLADRQTFEFYNIHPRDIIVALPYAPQEGDARKWIRFTQDTDAFSERIACIVNPDISKEAGRLRDFQLARMERRPRQFRRYLANWEKAAPEPAKKRAMTVVGPAPQVPSEAPLPICWARSAADFTFGASEPPAVKYEQLVGVGVGESIRQS